MALPMKKKQTAGTVDNLNTATKSHGAVTTAQVHGAMKALAKKKGQMSKKSRKRVAGRLKGMIGGK